MQQKRIVSKQQQERYDWDYRLVQLSLSGDETAWEMLYEKAYPLAIGTVYKADPCHMLCAEDVEEIAAEALLKCYQKREEFEARNLFSTWVGGFAKKITKQYQSKYHQRLKKEQTVYYESLPATADPLYIVLRKERNYYMWLALETMEEPGRSLFLWYQMDACTKAQARRRTGVKGQDMEEKAQRAILQYQRDFWHMYPG